MRPVAIAASAAILALMSISCKKEDSSTNAGSTGTTQVPDVFKKFDSAVTISVDGNFVVLTTKDLPNHPSPYWGTGSALYEAPDSGMIVNPNRIQEQNVVFRIPLNPAIASSITATPLGPIGIALNGVCLFNQYAGPNQPLTNEIRSFDRFNGHPQQFGEYHYHFEPLKITANDSSLVGFMLDGFPVYGKKDMDGSTPANLDAANGHTAATREYPAGIYHYHITDTVPYICGGYRGTPGTVTN